VLTAKGVTTQGDIIQWITKQDVTTYDVKIEDATRHDITI